MISQEELLELVEYKDGKLYWKVSRKGQKKSIEEELGFINNTGYKRVRIGRELYLIHRLVWLYHYGYFPENDLDHINRNRLDNRVENLREASRQCNVRNSCIRSDNKSGIKGVSFSITKGKWIAQIQANGIVQHLYVGHDLSEAVAHRLAAEQALSWSGCDSTSPAYLFMKAYVQ